MVEVILIVRPKEVSTTSAPWSCARRATWKAIEESMRTPVTSSFLPSSNMAGLSLGVWQWVVQVVVRAQCPMPRPPSTGMTAPEM